MATLQTIRSKGPLLVIVIGVGLFAFLAGDFFKLFQTHGSATSVGEVNGTSLSVMDYQQKVNIATESYKNMTGANVSDAMMASLRDQVWNSFIMEELISSEAEKIGLRVTDTEIQDVIESGVHPMLSNAPIGVNPQTRRFDKDVLKNFMLTYNTQMSQMDASTAAMYKSAHEQWVNFEKELALNLLAEKYQSLFAASMLSNKVEAEYMYNARANQYNTVYAAVPYRSIPDSTVKVSDSDLKKIYDRDKDFRYKQMVDGRDLTYVQVEIVASQADKDALLAKVEQASEGLKADMDNYASYVKAEGSTAAYVDMLRAKEAYPSDVMARLDSVKVGEVFAPYFNVADNSYNTFKLLAKAEQADSVRFQNIIVMRDTKEATQELSDSIYKAIKGGADFVALAEKYNGTVEPQWVYSSQFNYGIDADNAKYFSELFAASKSDVYQTKVGEMSVITNVMDKKGSVKKYKAAVVKCPVTFSDETYTNEYNKFSQFVAANRTVESIVANAESNGYRVRTAENVGSNAYGVGNIMNSREALRWAFNKAKVGEVSDVFECGDNNTLLVLAVTGEYKPGYMPFESVKSQLMPEALKNKKAEKIISDLNSRNLASIDAYKSVENVVSDTLKLVTFSSPVNVMGIGGGEYVLSGLASKAEMNKVTKPVKGNNAVYVLDVYSTNKTNETLDVDKELKIYGSSYQRSASGILSDLYQKSEVEDNRYLFF